MVLKQKFQIITIIWHSSAELEKVVWYIPPKAKHPTSFICITHEYPYITIVPI
jgi:hypothetical protein